jgi:hypothetical protein
VNRIVLALTSAALVAGLVVVSYTADNPEKMARIAWGHSQDERFPGLARELQITPAQAEEFLDLLGAQQRALAPISDGLLAKTARDPDTRLRLQRQLVDLQRSNLAAQAAMLGGRHARWLEYQSALLVRQQVEELQARLAAGSNALRESQVQPLLAVLTPEQLRLDRDLRDWNTSDTAVESPHMLDEHMRRTVANQRHLLDVAAPLLEPLQREEYWRVLDQIAMREVALTRAVGKLATAPVRTLPARRVSSN